MKGLVFILTFTVGLSFGQNKRYYDLLDRTEGEQMEPHRASAAELNIIGFDKQDYGGLIFGQLNESRKRRGRNGLIIDSVFQQVCNTGVKHFSSTFFKSHKHTDKVVRHTEFGIRHLKGENRLFKVVALNINLTTLKGMSPFFYYAQDPNTSLKLYKGKRPKTLNPNHADYEEPVPVKPITEIMFTEDIEAAIKSSVGVSDFFSKTYTHIGIGVRLDEYSVNRRKIPHAFVLIILGGKQTQKVRINQPVTSPADEDNPFLILR